MSDFADGPHVYINKTATTTPLLVNVSGTNLQERKTVYVQNLGNRDIYVGFDSSVSNTSGLKVDKKGGQVAVEAGTLVDIYAVTKNGSSDIRIWELS